MALQHLLPGFGESGEGTDMSDFTCGELYEEGNCAGCGMPQLACPSYKPGTLQLEFLGASGNVLYGTTTETLPMDMVRGMVNTFTFPFRSHVHAVRVNGEGREILIRRPVGAYGPGGMPLPRSRTKLDTV